MALSKGKQMNISAPPQIFSINLQIPQDDSVHKGCVEKSEEEHNKQNKASSCLHRDF